MGCKAESLGVDLPKGGVDAVSQEDLKRDMWLMNPPTDPRGVFVSRIQQMHALPAFGQAYTADGGLVCGQKDGALPSGGDASDLGAVVIGVPLGSDALGDAMAIAALISLAKTHDTVEPPPKTLLFCLWDLEDGVQRLLAQPPVPIDSIQAIVALGPLWSGTVQIEEQDAVQGIRSLSVGSDGLRNTQDRDAIDYRGFADRVQQVATEMQTRLLQGSG
mgnify:CR=1 FL=1